MSHRYHPNENDDPEAILWDDCEDCEHRTKNLGLTLDPKNWWAMWNQMLDVEIEGDESYYRSNNEAILAKAMYNMYVALECYTIIDPTLEFMKKG